MGSVIDYVECKCGNQEMVSDYYYKSDELYEFCDVCGHYYNRSITNRPKERDEKGRLIFPEGWKAVYEEKEGETGFVLRIFQKESKGHTVSCIDVKNIPDIIDSLEKDDSVFKFAITFKDKSGHYQTQIYNKQK